MSEAAADAVSRVERLFEAKAAAELRSADELLGGRPAIASAGRPIASVMLVKGDPGDADRRESRVLAGADGDAVEKALQALGFGPDDTYAVCSRPGSGDEAARARRLEAAVEAVDPRLVIALDPEAGADLAAAFGLKGLPPSRPATVRGRTLGALAGFEASLGDEAAKRRVWGQMLAVAAPVTGTPAKEARKGRP